MDFLIGPRTLPRWAVANLIGNMAIVWTGALVRLTDSGLGCATWPQCEPGSYLPHPEAPLHAYIEFGNRLLTFVLIIIALGTFLAALRSVRAGRQPRRVAWLSFAVGVGIIGQAVVGGISVLTQLNPWVVGLHMVLSVALIVVCTRIVHEVFGLAATPVPTLPWVLSQVVFFASLAMMYLGTVTSGSGPHAGDGAATRNGFNLADVARVHSLFMWVTLGCTLALVVTARSLPRLRRSALAVLGVAVLQGAVGYTQYLLQLPEALVLAHMVGTTVYTVAVAHLWFGVRRAAPPAAQKTSGSTAAARNTTAR